jgi:hypothetical protein
MFSALKSLVSPPSSAMVESARRDVAEKAAVCRGIFFAARELARQRVYGPPLESLLERAGDTIGDIDSVLVALDPVREAPTFAVAASLQRQLEELQASITERRRRRRSLAR